MEINLEDKKKEAIERMKLWEIPISIIKDFSDKGTIFGNTSLIGDISMTKCLGRVKEEQLQRIKKFEKEHNALVYFVIHNYAEFGELENYLYVSDYNDEWSIDREDIEKSQQLAYVHNCTDTELSEFGCIGLFKTTNLGPIRIW